MKYKKISNFQMIRISNLTGIFTIVIFALLTGCEDHAGAKQRIKPALSSSLKSLEKPAASSKHEEYLEFDSVLIFGKLPFKAKKEDLFKLLGQPDSTAVPDLNDNCGYYYNDNFQLVYIGGSDLEISGEAGIVRSVTFKNSPGVFLKTPGLELTGQTTLSALSELYPESVKKQQPLLVSEYGPMISVWIESSKTQSENGWLLLFQDDKLVRFEYYIPC